MNKNIRFRVEIPSKDCDNIMYIGTPFKSSKANTTTKGWIPVRGWRAEMTFRRKGKMECEYIRLETPLSAERHVATAELLEILRRIDGAVIYSVSS